MALTHTQNRTESISALGELLANPKEVTTTASSETENMRRERQQVINEIHEVYQGHAKTITDFEKACAPVEGRALPEKLRETVPGYALYERAKLKPFLFYEAAAEYLETDLLPTTTWQVYKQTEQLAHEALPPHKLVDCYNQANIILMAARLATAQEFAANLGKEDLNTKKMNVVTTATTNDHDRTVLARHIFHANVKQTFTRWIRETPV